MRENMNPEIKLPPRRKYKRKGKPPPEDEGSPESRRMTVQMWPEHDIALAVCVNHLKNTMPKPQRYQPPTFKVEESSAVRWALLEMAKILVSGMLPDRVSLEESAALNGNSEELDELTDGPDE